MCRVDGSRCLVLRRLCAAPDRGVMAELYQVTLADALEDHIQLRGVERVESDKGPAAVVQVWQVKPRPNFGGLGRAHPDAKWVVEHLVRAG